MRSVKGKDEGGRMKDEPRMIISKRLAKRLASRMGHGFVAGLGPKRVAGGRLGLRKRMRYAGGINILPTVQEDNRRNV